eukprot:3850718-Prymnesium_polylepis.1
MTRSALGSSGRSARAPAPNEQTHSVTVVSKKSTQTAPCGSGFQKSISRTREVSSESGEQTRPDVTLETERRQRACLVSHSAMRPQRGALSSRQRSFLCVITRATRRKPRWRTK